MAHAVCGEIPLTGASFDSLQRELPLLRRELTLLSIGFAHLALVRLSGV